MNKNKQLEIMKEEILFIIEEFELGGINAFECIKQIKEKLND